MTEQDDRPPGRTGPEGTTGPEGATGPARSAAGGEPGATAPADPATPAGPAGPAARDDAAPAGPGHPPLRRSRDGRVVAGVCDGAGRYFDVDPVIFRIVLAVLALTGGLGLIIYGLGWLLVPQEDETESEAHRLLSGRIEGSALTAVLIALVGCGLYASMIGNGGDQAFSLLLLAAVAGAVYRSRQRHRAQRDGEPADALPGPAVDAPPAAQAPPTPGGTPSWWREPLGKDPLGKDQLGTQPAGTGTGYLWGPDDGPYAEEHRQEWQRRRAVDRRGGGWLGLVVFVLALVAGIVGTEVSWHGRPLGTSLEIGFAAALAVYGLGFVVSTFFGRVHGGALVAVLLSALLAGSVALPHSVSTDWKQQTWRPTSAASVQPVYDLGTGQGTLDLTALRFDGGTVTTRLQVGVGEAKVLLPADVTVHLDYRAGLGDVQVPGGTGRTKGVHPDLRDTVTLGPVAQGDKPSGTLELQVEIGVGSVKVVR